MSAENSKKPGAGRGLSLLEKMKAQRAGTSMTPMESQPATPSSFAATSESTPEPSGAGRGRASLLAMMKGMKSEAPSSQVPQAPVSALTAGAGRASLLSLMRKTHVGQSTTEPVVPKSAVPESSHDPAGVVGKLSDLSIYDTKSTVRSEPISRQGTWGKPETLTANYINLKVNANKGMFLYEVKYSPNIDSTLLRRKLLNQHSATIGHTKTFDGSQLYLPIKLPDKSTTLNSEHPADGSTVTLTVIFKKEQPMHENIQFFNVLFNRVMRALNMVKIGQDNFNPKLATSVPQHRLEVWPGYVTAVNEYEGGLKLCVDAKHRVLRTDTIRDLITDLYQRRSQDFRKAVTNEIIGLYVLTRYNNKTYRVDDIEWDKNPTFSFKKNDNLITLVEYYKTHWNLVIEDHKQPLLVHREKKKTTTGETYEDLILLVPELCYVAGLTDSIRSDFRVMKDLDAVTKIGPNIRRKEILKFVAEVQNNEVTRKILAEWGLELEQDTTCFTGRVFDPETILFGQNESVSAGRQSDWGRDAVNKPVLNTPHLNNWYVLYCQKDRTCVSDFVNMVKNVCKPMAMKVNEPRMIVLRDDRTESYINELRKCIEPTVQIVVTIVTSNRGDRYAAIKKLCCVERPIASQVIISRTISRADRLKSVTQKVVLQMNCKLGGALWALKMPFDNCMVCGVDVHHAGVQQGVRGSVAGFVASLDKLLTSWFSKVCLQNPHQELVDLLQGCLVSAIKAYYKQNQRYPDRIMLYRDGVGDGQIDTVAKYEVKQLLATFSRIDPSYKPELSIILVQKRINTRIFSKSKGGNLDNPLPGTIVDCCVTKRNYYDFYLVSQHVRQGTVTPTHYIVIYDGANMKTDHMQRFTYKLCHMYYNQSATIRVPAPCQYAHKLAFLVGQNFKMEPSDLLSNTLYYL